MSLPDPFRWDGDHVAVSLPGARVVFTTRRGGVSAGPYATLNLGLWTDDDSAAVSENRDRVAALAGIARDRFQQGRQVHGAVVRAPDDPPAGEPVESDGQVTGLESVAPVVLTADCLPIALARPGRVGMLHAGWRGLQGGIVAAGVAAFGDEPPLAAAIGPGVRRGRNLDLKAIAATHLREAGVAEVHDCGLCTMCSDPDLFFSHRRDGGVTGRQAGVAWRS